MKRRDFFKAAGAVSAAVGFSATLGNESARADEMKHEPFYPGTEGKPKPGWGDSAVEHNTTYFPDFADKNLWIRRDNQVMTCYRTNPNQKYPYLFPLAGPISRVSVTAESAQPWPHHRSVFLGADRVNGGNYWQATSNDGQILSQDVQLLKTEKNQVEWTDRCVWTKPGQPPIMEDSRRYLLDWRAENYYVLDLFVSFKAIEDVVFQKSNHGFFGVRVEQDLAPEGGGTLVNAEGDSGQAATLGKPSKWMTFWGKRRFNLAITEGVSVFCPPKPFENCPWFTRDYGNCSPMPFNFFKDGETLTWPKGNVTDFVYRIVVFGGEPASIDLNGLWNEIYG